MRGLVAVGVAAAVVDRAEHRGRVVGVHERARAVVDRLAGDRHVVGVHHAVHEADEHPPRDQRRPGRSTTRRYSARYGFGGVGGVGVVAGDGVVGERAQRRPGRRARRRTGTCRPAGGSRRPGRAPRRAATVSRTHLLAGGDDRQRPRGRDPERVHRLADQVLAQHRADRGLAVAAAGERRAPRSLEVQVAAAAVDVDHLAEQQRPAVAEARRRTCRTGGRRRPARPASTPSGSPWPTSSDTPAGSRSAAASTPSSAASSSLSTSSSGAGHRRRRPRHRQARHLRGRRSRRTRTASAPASRPQATDRTRVRAARQALRAA